MSIHFITGKPGGGKGVYAMKVLIDEIRSSRRAIVTNFAIKLDPWIRGGVPQLGLKGYLMAKYGEYYDIDKRVRFLSPGQVATFYSHRRDPETGKDYDYEIWSKEGGGSDGNESLEKAWFNTTECFRFPAVYCLDEVWSEWPARDWQKTGKPLLFYNAQHRKAGDTVLLTTQNTKQLDTAIRQLAQDFTVVRNHSKEKFSFFKAPNCFSLAVYSEPPDKSSTPQERRAFKLDVKGVGGCFDTSAGVGVVGIASADKGERRKGLPFAALIVGFLVLLGSVALIPWGIGKLAKRVLTPSVTKRPVTNDVQTLVASNPPPVKEEFLPLRPRELVKASEFERPVKALDESETVYLTGLVPMLDRVYVTLSDGSQYWQGDPELKLVTREFVVVGSKVYKWPKARSVIPSQARDYYPSGSVLPPRASVAGSGERRAALTIIDNSKVK